MAAANDPRQVVRRVRRECDVAPATFLFRLSYDRLGGVAESELLTRIEKESRRVGAGPT